MLNNFYDLFLFGLIDESYFKDISPNKKLKNEKEKEQINEVELDIFSLQGRVSIEYVNVFA